MIPTLETARLILRPLELADADQAQVLFPQWDIVRYLRKIGALAVSARWRV
jgi:[ribosomal protein S5]-alanine N-acetyltransferase